MGKVIQNCPCCRAGVCTCCCNKGLSRNMTVTFTLTDSDDGAGGTLSCCLDGVSVPVSYAGLDFYKTDMHIWTGSVENICDYPIWVIVACPKGYRQLLVGVACSQEQPAYFDAYTIQTNGFTYVDYSSPYKYGFYYTHVDGLRDAINYLPVVENLTWQYPDGQLAFDKQAFLYQDQSSMAIPFGGLYYEDCVAGQNIWVIPPVSDGTWLKIDDSVITLPLDNYMRHGLLFKDFSDIGSNFAIGYYTDNHPSGIVLRKNDNGFLWITELFIWQIENLDNQGPPGIKITTLAGRSHKSTDGAGGSYEYQQVHRDTFGAGLRAWFSPFHYTTAGTFITVWVNGDDISVYENGGLFTPWGRLLYKINSSFNSDATSHGIIQHSDDWPNGSYPQSFAIWNMPVMLGESDQCSSDSLVFSGQLLSIYGEGFPSQDMEQCNCIPDSTGAYLNLKVDVASDLTSRTCETNENDCNGLSCDDCYFVGCQWPDEMIVELWDAGSPFTAGTDEDPTDVTRFNQPFTLRKLSRFEHVWWPELGPNCPHHLFPTRNEWPSGYNGGNPCNGVLYDGTLWQQGSLLLNVYFGCIWISEPFEVALSPDCDAIMNIVNDPANGSSLTAEQIADSQKTLFRWELSIRGPNSSSTEYYGRLALVTEKGTQLYDAWESPSSFYGDANPIPTPTTCDGPWQFQWTEPVGNRSTDFLLIPYKSIVTPEFLKVTPHKPTDVSTLATVCPACCDGFGSIGRTLKLSFEDASNPNNNTNVTLVMDTWFGQCNTAYENSQGAFWEWNSGIVQIADNPQLASFGTDGGITNWQFILNCRFHNTGNLSGICANAPGGSCGSAFRYAECGHSHWVLHCIGRDIGGSQVTYQIYIVDDDGLIIAEMTGISGGTAISNALTSSCTPFFIEGDITSLGPDSVTRSIMINEQ